MTWINALLTGEEVVFCLYDLD